MPIQSDELTMVWLGVEHDAPVEAVQPALPDGVHLRWMFRRDRGFPWYGYGYFLASLLAFAVAYLMVADAVRRLPYFAFVANNPSVR